MTNVLCDEMMKRAANVLNDGDDGDAAHPPVTCCVRGFYSSHAVCYCLSGSMTMW